MKKIFRISICMCLLLSLTFFLSSCKDKHTHVESNPVIENKVEATCTKEGSYLEIIYCSDCGEELSREYKTIAKKSHTKGDVIIENKVEATCAKEGSYDEVVNCTVCEKEITRVSKTIAKLAHTESAIVIENKVEATCTKEGSYDEVVSCTVCSEELSRNTVIVPVVAHTESAIVIENKVEATCTKEGSYEEVINCTVCSEEISRTKKTIDIIDHKESAIVIENKVEATCLKEGSYDEVVKCSVCDKELSRTTKKEAIVDHIYVVIIIKATCTEQGYTEHTCKYCEDSYQDTYTEKTSHNFVNGVCKDCEAVEYSVGLEYKLSSNNNHYIVTGIGTCTDINIIIPEEYNSLIVAEIGEKAFYECGTIISIQLPDSILKIGDKAFASCEKLEEINIPDNVELGIDVFRGSIIVEITIKHQLVYVPQKDASCDETGNIEHYLCQHCNMYYQDKDGEIRIYEVIIAKTHNFSNGICSSCGETQNDKYIVKVDEVGYLGKFALGTLENAIGLPSKINVYTADGKTHSLNIAWNMNGYDKTKAGLYTITSIIQTGEFYFDESVSNVIVATVEIVEQIKGTADIVFILDISGSMGDEIANVKNNIIEFAQKIEDRGVSARWSAITYSDFTVSGANEKTQIIMNGASQWFSSASEYKNAINKIVLANGGDYEETAIDGLMHATTLSTRQDARVFYILLTDATYKINNNYGVTSINQTAQILDSKNINVSVIAPTDLYSYYSTLSNTTGGMMCNIYGNFSLDLFNTLVPIIYDEVIA